MSNKLYNYDGARKYIAKMYKKGYIDRKTSIKVALHLGERQNQDPDWGKFCMNCIHTKYEWGILPNGRLGAVGCRCAETVSLFDNSKSSNFFNNPVYTKCKVVVKTTKEQFGEENPRLHNAMLYCDRLKNGFELKKELRRIKEISKYDFKHESKIDYEISLGLLQEDVLQMLKVVAKDNTMKTALKVTKQINRRINLFFTTTNK